MESTEGATRAAGRRIAVIGGGPVGLHCLLRATTAGWDARLYERGALAQNVREWGHVRMFSPHAMNVPPGAAEHAPLPAVAADELLTGAEYVERVLEPLAASPLLAGRIALHSEVVGVSRATLRKADAIRTAERSRQPFRLLVEDARGEHLMEADVVVDATGTFGEHNWLGAGGIPAAGERALAARVRYRLPDLLNGEREAFRGSHVVVAGAGHSAASAVLWLEMLAREAPGTRVSWLTRTSRRRPVPEVPDDPLEERARVSRRANDLAERGAPWLDATPGAGVVELRPRERGVAVLVESDGGTSWLTADRVLALVGYRPDLALTRELQLQTCWATEGTYGLAAALLAERDGAADCLRTPTPGASTLLHPEERFFTVGAKSYGRNPHVLMRTGFEQVDQVLALLRGGD